MSEKFGNTRGRARLGIVVPVTNTNLEPDFCMLLPPGISMHVTRAGGYDTGAIPDEKQMQQYSDAPLDEVIDNLRLCRSDILLYGCTSATLAQGTAYDQRFRERIEADSGLPAVTAASALVDTLARLGVSRFAFTSPYVASLNDLAVSFLEAAGTRCVGRHDAPRPLGNNEVAAITPEQIVATARLADRDDAEAIVISCTDYRATEAVTAIERDRNKPVVTSNLALMLNGLARLGIEQPAHYGECFRAARAWS